MSHPPSAANGAPGRPVERRHPLSTGMRLGVVAAMLLGGLLGFLITFSVFRITSSPGSAAPWLWGVVGAVAGLVGTAIVVVLAARSFGEWSMYRDQQAAEADHPSESDA